MTNKNTNTEQKLIETISKQTEIPCDEISLDTPLGELGIDSLSFMALIASIQVAFDVKITSKDMAKIYYVKDIIPLIKNE